MQVRKISNLATCSVLLLSVISCKKEEAKPNVILFLTDDLGYNDISCYRQANFPNHVDSLPTSQTPNVDLLARQGMRFTDFYCGNPVSSPSRSALMTGRNSTRVGIYNWIPPNAPMHMRDREITLAEMFKQNEYATGHFGKWHLSSDNMNHPLPNDQGFDYSFYAYNNAIPSHHNPENYYRNGEPAGRIEGYACDIVVTEAINWLDKNKDKPFFMNVWFNEPHVKVAAPEELTKRHRYNQEYYGAIENMDIAIGKLVNYLEENKIENTIIIFASDNGSQWDCSNLPMRGEKCFTYEGGVRVPFIIKWDKHIPEGKVSEFNGSFTDIFPTFSSLLKTPLPADRTIDGMDISSVFLGETENMKREKPIFFFRYYHDPICMLRDGDWCLLGYDSIIPYSKTLNEGQLGKIRPWNFTEGHMEYLKNLVPQFFELYNLKDDLGQKTDLAGEYPDRVEKMKAQMLSLRKEMVAEGGDWYENQQ